MAELHSGRFFISGFYSQKIYLVAHHEHRNPEVTDGYYVAITGLWHFGWLGLIA
jgi:hypothetical protein